MPHSIINAKLRRLLLQGGVILFWLLMWHGLALFLNRELLLVSPLSVLRRLTELAQQSSFWLAIANSLWRILQGFFWAVLVGILLAALAQKHYIYIFINPLLSLMKATPVASCTILVLFWVHSRNLSIVISFMMVLPIVFYNVYEGLSRIDVSLLEMALVFRIGFLKRLRYIIIPSILPYFISACSVGFGQAWKSGVAAEVIALPNDSIGINLYNAKVYLENADLLSWTAVIVLLSYLMERTFLLLVGLWTKRGRKRERVQGGNPM